MRLGDLKKGDLFCLIGDGKTYEYQGRGETLVKLLDVALNRTVHASPAELVQLTHRQVENLLVGEWFHSRHSGRLGNWQVVAKYSSNDTVIGQRDDRQEAFRYGDLVEPQALSVPTHEGWVSAPAGVRHVIGRRIEDLDDDRLWERALHESKRWAREAMANSIRRLGCYQHGCPTMTARFDELHRIAEYVGVDFWDVAFNMVGFAACRQIISSILKSKGFKDGAKEMAVHSDPAKDPRGDLVERIFRQDFI